jgi:hypothetical protein
MDLLSLIMVDPYETPIQTCQDVINKMLFGKDKQNIGSRDSPDKCLVNFALNNYNNELTISFNH